MSAPAQTAPVDAAGPSEAGDADRRGRRTWLLLALALVAGVAVTAWARSGSEEFPGRLDPRNPGRDGAQAVARVLEREGVDVAIVRSAAALDDADVDGATVVVTSTQDLSPSTLDRLRARARAAERLVLVDAPYPVALAALPGLSSDADEDVERRAACRGDGAADLGLDDLRLAADAVTTYRGEGVRVRCFTGTGGAVLVSGDGVVLFGGGDALTNDQVLRADDAAIALRLLGSTPRLVWYVPDPTDATADEAVSLTSLLPDAVLPSLWLGAVGVLALLLWRVRRLGALVSEPLPVVVRAIETARSRGRLYRRSGDRAHAARALVDAARTDLAARLRLERTASAAQVGAAAAHHLDRSADAVALAALLDPHRPPPASDQDLVELARTLARLRREVRRR